MDEEEKKVGNEDSKKTENETQRTLLKLRKYLHAAPPYIEMLCLSNWPGSLIDLGTERLSY